MKRFLAFSQQAGVSALLLLAFALQGAKTPETFFIWSTLALLLVIFTVWKNPDLFHPARFLLEWLLALCLLISYLFSLDRSASLFQALQWGTLLMVWMILKAQPLLTRDKEFFFKSLWISGLWALAFTLWQYAHGDWRYGYGYLPINVSLNAVWLTCLGVLFIGHSLTQKTNRLRFFLELGFGCLLVLTPFIGSSRAAPVVGMGGLLYLFRPWIKLRHCLWAMFLIALALLLFSSKLTSRLRINEGNYRSQIWKIALEAIQDRPILGYGPGNYELAYQKYAFPVDTDTVRYSRTTTFAHNEYLQVGAEVGIPAFMIILLGVGHILSRRVGKTLLPRTVKATFLVLSLTSLFLHIWHLPLLLLLTLVLSAMLYHSSSPNVFASAIPNPFLIRAGYLLISLVLIFASALCALRHRWASQGKWDTVCQWLPKDAEAWHEWSKQQSNPEKVLLGARQAVLWSPSMVFYRESLGRVLEATRNYPEAVEEYKTALQLAPGRAINALAIGRILFINNNPTAALEWFKQARLIEHHYWECDLWIARCLYQSGKTQQARWALDNLVQRRDDYLAWRTAMFRQLPSENLPSGYSDTLLQYDPEVIRQERLKYRK